LEISLHFARENLLFVLGIAAFAALHFESQALVILFLSPIARCVKPVLWADF
jgi:hypothetical protein